MLLFVLVPLFLIILYIYSAQCYKHWEKKGVKQLPSYPPFGSFWKSMFRKVALQDIMLDLYNNFPELRYFGVYQFRSPVLLLKDPELIKQICVKDFEHFLDHTQFLSEDNDPLWNKNLFALTGQKWKEMRSTLSPSFTGSKMRQIFVLMQKCSESVGDFLLNSTDKDIVELELKDVFTRYTNDVIATTAFGIQCDSMKDRDNEFYLRGKIFTDNSGFWRNLKMNLVIMMPWLGKIIDGSIFNKEISNFFRHLIKESIEYRTKNHIERPDMINQLMNVNKELPEEEVEENSFATVQNFFENNGKNQIKPKTHLTIDDIASQALIFFFAGFETVSVAMCLMAYELAVNPDIQKKLIDELDDYRTRKTILTYEGLSELKYFDMVLSETLRKWPPNLNTDRKCTKQYTIQPIDSNETPLTITEEETIWIPTYGIHRDEKFWPEPLKFDLERFSPENKSKIVPYSYIPFGIGPRNCIGSRYALIEIKSIFYSLLTRFEIVPVAKSCIPFKEIKGGFTFAAEDGFYFGLKKRDF